MFVPTFQGLGALDFVRPANQRRAPYPFAAAHQVHFYRARNAIYHLFQKLQANGRQLTVLVPDYNSGNEVLALEAAGAAVCYYNTLSDFAVFSDDVTHTKVALELSDVSSCTVERFRVYGPVNAGPPSANYFTGGTGSIGIRTKGREATRLVVRVPRRSDRGGDDGHRPGDRGRTDP